MNIEHRKYILYDNQISGKQPKLISDDGTKIMKGYSPVEYQFYNYLSKLIINDPSHQLIYHLPQFYGEVNLGKDLQPQLDIEENPTTQNGESSIGNQTKSSKLTEWLQHLKTRYQTRNPDNRFILLENLTLGYQVVNAMDIKIGGRGTGKAFKPNFSVDGFGLKMNGIKSTHLCSQQVVSETRHYFLSKYYLSQFIKNRHDIISHIAFFFYNKGHLQRKAIEQVIVQLKEISLAMKSFHKFKFISSSVYIMFDPTSKIDYKIQVKLIDFGRIASLSPEEIYDVHSCQGLESLINFLMEIIENLDKYQLIVKKQELNLFKEEHNKLVIPERKLKEYQSPTFRPKK